MENKLASSFLDQSKGKYELYSHVLEMLFETNRDVFVPFKEGKMYFEKVKLAEHFKISPIDQNIEVPLNEDHYYRMYIFHYDLKENYNNDYDLLLDYKKMKMKDFAKAVVKEAPASLISFRGYYDCCYNRDAIFQIWEYCFDSKGYDYHKHLRLVKEPI